MSPASVPSPQKLETSVPSPITQGLSSQGKGSQEINAQAPTSKSDYWAQMQALVAAAPQSRLCNCVGPQNGEPRCPCAMSNVVARNGRWIQKEVDLGPVR